MDSLDKMIFRLFLKPLAFVGLGIGVLLLLGVWIPVQLSEAPMLAPIGQMAASAALPAAGALFLTSTGMFLMRAWRLRQWQLGKGLFCHRCSGMVQEETVRSRSCYRCLSCNQRRYL